MHGYCVYSAAIDLDLVPWVVISEGNECCVLSQAMPHLDKMMHLQRSTAVVPTTKGKINFLIIVGIVVQRICIIYEYGRGLL